jgi:two-component SAPR family response regulator
VEQVAGEGEGDAGTRLEVYALGEGRVARDGEEVPSSAWQAAMAKELFFYVLLHGPVERDELGVVFWPDLPLKKMRNSFHTTLHRVRGALGAEAIVNEEGRYRVGDVGLRLDVDELEGAVERARLLPAGDWQAEELWRQAVDLYGGDFLPEVGRPWAVARRERLRELYFEALVGVGRCHEARGEAMEALAWYRRALEVDDLREDVHRRVMACYAAAGRRSDALDQYERCRETLARELGLEPAEETESLRARVAGERKERQEEALGERA